MIALARLLTRLIGLILAALIAVAGLAAAVFCIQGGHGTLSLPGLAADLRLPALRSDVNFFLGRLTASGSVAILAAAAGVGAILAGMLMLAGAWVPVRSVRIVLARNSDGVLLARRRGLSRALADDVAGLPDVSRVRVRATPRRRHDGGRVRVRARAAVGAERRQVRIAATHAAGAMSDELPLRIRVHARRASRRDRRRELAA